MSRIGVVKERKQQKHEYMNQYNIDKEERREYMKQYYIDARRKAWVVLGPEKCIECGRLSGLEIAHIDGLHGKRRMNTLALYRWIINNPEEAVKRHGLLCANCNWLEALRDNNWTRNSPVAQRNAEAIVRLGGKCMRCGITNVQVLTVDHINDDGARDRQERTKHQITTYILTSNLEEVKESFQCLCWACQREKERSRRLEK